MKMKNYFLFFLLMVLPTMGFSQACKLSGRCQRPIEPAFEKLYVCQSQLVYLPDGLYYCNQEGKLNKVRTLLHDCDGMYIIIIRHQCPLCGRSWEFPPDENEFGCPIYQKEVLPDIWSK